MLLPESGAYSLRNSFANGDRNQPRVDIQLDDIRLWCGFRWLEPVDKAGGAELSQKADQALLSGRESTC
jgi:hypothetical protein